MLLTSPDFLSPATVYFNGLSGVATPMRLPWVSSFEKAKDIDICVLTQSQRQFLPGMYVNAPVSTDNIQSQWKFALLLDDLCNLVAESSQVIIVLNPTSAYTKPTGYQSWVNGQLFSSSVLTPAPNAVWVLTPPNTQAEVNGFDVVNIELVDAPSSLQVISSADTTISVFQGGALISKIHTVELKTVGGRSLGLAVIGTDP